MFCAHQRQPSGHRVQCVPHCETERPKKQKKNHLPVPGRDWRKEHGTEAISPSEAISGAEERRAELPCEERLAVLANGVDGEPVPPQLLLHLVAPRAALAEPEDATYPGGHAPHREVRGRCEAHSACARAQQFAELEGVLAVAPRRPPALLLACGAEERLGQQGEAMAAGGGA
jgi:hypothetical protein